MSMDCMCAAQMREALIAVTKSMNLSEAQDVAREALAKLERVTYPVLADIDDNGIVNHRAVGFRGV